MAAERAPGQEPAPAEHADGQAEEDSPDARFINVPASTTTCTATVSLLNSAGSSPSTTASARV